MKRRLNAILLLFTIAAIAVFLALPSGFERTQSGTRTSLRIEKVDDSALRQFGIVRTGDQSLDAFVENGPFKGRNVEAVNHLMGRLEFDRIYRPGDRVLATIDSAGGDVIKATVVDYYRIGKECALLLLFFGLLIAFSGWVGVRSILSFVFTGLAIWKLLLPGLLRGWNPIVASLGLSAVLTVVIVLLVSGIDRKGISACIGSLCGIAATCAIAICFGGAFSIHGAVKPFSETLLYSGFGHLDLTGIFLGSIFLASSGAVMDLSMDVASAMSEIVAKKPDISAYELARSGFAISRMVVGTMTTTLLLAYTGGFTTLLMVFIAQGTPVVNILNIQYVAAEMLHTLAGSIGLVTVAPFTSIVGAWILTGKIPAAGKNRCRAFSVASGGKAATLQI